MRLPLALGAFLLVAPAADAAVRPIQAYDRPSPGLPLWMPTESRELIAQPGDTVRWTFAQPGNPVAAAHDVMLTRPGQTAEVQIGASYKDTSVDEVVAEGDYTFRCSIHPDSMSGAIKVRQGDPTPVIDPGRPWEAPPVIADPGPPPAVNATSPPTVFEEGDNVAPKMTLTRVSKTRRSARIRVTVSEAGTLHLRLLRGRDSVSFRRVKVKAGTTTASLALPRRGGRYRLAVWTTDAVGLESKWRYKTLRL